MSDQGPIFVDQFGTGRGPSGGGPDRGPNWQPEREGSVWKLAWQGHLELQEIFWVYFVFGHGVVLGVGCGLMVFGMLAGFVSDPGSIGAGAWGLAGGAALLAAIYLPFIVWSLVSVWRCADNCEVKTRGVWARVIVVGYATALVLPVADYIIG
ncbi:MAG: hypothetical protein HOB37_04295 [Rhodospirillaceae bacterium]|nr:hypothetical protein [Rhodospirillaceae bacterium]MBT3908418.1 hypothetical protein [Rhodospirillaceae bacterium]MBT5300336.1 hypothetical protein [Rhodospirillaceae bacterium]MBT5512969.1 hypothetical protein [Rhodospirillaceae bacterium]MBT6607673.1 hypothetical protein [Rhodospirillaceae bacterium]